MSRAVVIDISDGAERWAAQANEHHRMASDAAGSAIEHAIAAGEALDAAKRAVGHGRWGEWLRKNFDGSERRAREYMQLFNGRDRLEANRRTPADLTIDAALRRLAAPRPRRSEPQPEPKEEAVSHPPETPEQSAHVSPHSMRADVVRLRQTIDAARPLFEQGLRVKEVAAKLGITESIAADAKSRLGMTNRRTGYSPMVAWAEEARMLAIAWESRVTDEREPWKTGTEEERAGALAELRNARKRLTQAINKLEGKTR